MELPDLGKHCEETTCHRTDFLPLQCSCSRIFCHQHFLSHVFLCDSKNENNIQITSIDFISEMKVCFINGCKVKSLLPFECKKCKQLYCISHRFHESCPEITEEEKEKAKKLNEEVKQSFQSALKSVDDEVNKKLQKSIKSGKNSETANKINLMRLKGRSIGEKSIPTDDRLYFLLNYEHPKKGVTEKAVFVAKTWSIGRAIDSISKFTEMENKNNISTAPKLRLFKDGVCICDVMSESLNNLSETLNVIQNGDFLELKYD